MNPTVTEPADGWVRLLAPWRPDPDAVDPYHLIRPFQVDRTVFIARAYGEGGQMRCHPAADYWQQFFAGWEDWATAAEGARRYLAAQPGHRTGQAP